MFTNRIWTSILLLVIFLAGCRSGKIATVDFPDGSYQGEISKKGKKNGKGIYKWHDGSTYEGDFEDDLRHGNGSFKWANGESYKGDYLHDKRTGYGIYNWPDGSTYEGSFLNGKRHGLGTYVSTDKDIYIGEWFDDLQHGEGSLTRSDGTVVKGIWRNGKLLTIPSVIPPKAEKPKLSWKQASSAKKDESLASPVPQKVEKPEKLPVIPPAPITRQTSNEPSVSAPIETVALASTPVESISVLPKKPNLQEIKMGETVVEPERPVANRGASDDQNLWEGNRDEAELFFATYLINGIDTIFEKKTKAPFSGKMRVTDLRGNVLGEFEVLNGRMDGEEVYFDTNGFVTERTLWSNGKEIR